MRGCRGACVVARGAWLGGHMWLQGCVHGCLGVCVVGGGCMVGVGGMHSWGMCVVAGGVCMVVGGVCGCRGHAWLGGAWLWGHAWLLGGMHGGRGRAWDTTRYGK